MNKANIYYRGEGFSSSYSGEGPYYLEFNGEIIGSHFCSSRSWAEQDLIRDDKRQDVLKKYDIDEVYSNGRLVWSKEELKSIDKIEDLLKDEEEIIEERGGEENMEEKILKELNEFREKLDEIFVGKTPKLPEDIDGDYDCDIFIWRHPGMGNSKQIITGNPMSIGAATCSYLQTLMVQGLFDEVQIREMAEMAIKGFKGELED